MSKNAMSAPPAEKAGRIYRRSGEMTIEQIRLVQESYLKILPVKEITAARFYGRLFQLDPSLKALFTRDIKEQGKKFFDMMDLVVGGLNRFDEDVVPVVRALG